MPMTSNDLTAIRGIGPKVDQFLQDNGINTFDQLANTDIDKLSAILEEAGPRFRLMKRDVLEDWLQQAQLAAAGKWDELEALQQQVKSKH